MAVPNARSVLVFGTTHSPWTQLVLMTLHDRGVPATLVGFPTSFGKWVASGLVMPSAQFEPGAPWITGSDNVYLEIGRRFPLFEPDQCAGDGGKDLRESQAGLEKVFFQYCLGRTRNPLRFFHAFATMDEGLHPWLFAPLRSLMCLYFFLLINLGAFLEVLSGRGTMNMAGFEASLRCWEDKLADADFFHGETPGYKDFGFLGQLQCLASGLTDEGIALVRDCPRLLSWLKRMHRRLDVYPYHYTSRIVPAIGGRPPAPRLSDPVGQGLFWVGFALALVFWPFTLCWLGASFALRWRSGNQSGALRRRA